MTQSRVGMTLGSTTRNGGEFEFKKISLSLERDLVPAENPVDAYRDIKALLERMVNEFQGSKPAGTPTRAGNGNRAVPPRPAASKPPSLTVETVRERLAKWLPDLEIMDGFDGFAVKPKRFLGEVWSEVNEVMRLLGGKWQKGLKSTDGAWRIPK
jgi:hypothetical protein